MLGEGAKALVGLARSRSFGLKHDRRSHYARVVQRLLQAIPSDGIACDAGQAMPPQRGQQLLHDARVVEATLDAVQSLCERAAEPARIRSAHLGNQRVE